MSPVSEVAIEYAHSRLIENASYDSPLKLVISAAYARSLREVLTARGHRSTVQVLVDDKGIPPGSSRASSIAALRRDCQRELEPDCVVLESGLVHLLDQFLSETVNAPGSDRTRRSVLRYRDRHGGALACFHDIAIWHSLRLGRLNPNSLANSGADLGLLLTGEMWPCRVAVSILPRHDADAEDAANRRLLTRATTIDLEHQVMRYYFADDATEAAVDSAEWTRFVRSVELNLTATRGHLAVDKTLLKRNADFAWDDFDPEYYFAHNYSSLRDDDRQIIETMRDFFSSCDLPDGARGIDVGTGTNLYPALAMLPFARRVTLCEYSASNIAWLHNEVPYCSPSWRLVWTVLAKEAPYARVEDPFGLLPTRIRIVRGSVFDLPERRWDLGTMFFVAESISQSEVEFASAIRRFLCSLRSGAPFVAAFMRNSSGYRTGEVRYPAVAIDESHVQERLSGLVKGLAVRLIHCGEKPLRHGYNGMIVALGRVM